MDLERLLARQTQPVVLQRYLCDPMLLPGDLKFDIRLYGLVLSSQPPRFFLCREGLVRVCSESYEHPSKESGGTRCSRHRTPTRNCPPAPRLRRPHSFTAAMDPMRAATTRPVPYLAR